MESGKIIIADNLIHNINHFFANNKSGYLESVKKVHSNSNSRNCSDNKSSEKSIKYAPANFKLESLGWKWKQDCYRKFEHKLTSKHVWTCGGGIMIFSQEDRPNKLLQGHVPPVDKGLFTELNVSKCKWLLLGTCHPPSQEDQNYCNNLGKVLDTFCQYDNIL